MLVCIFLREGRDASLEESSSFRLRFFLRKLGSISWLY